VSDYNGPSALDALFFARLFDRGTESGTVVETPPNAFHDMFLCEPWGRELRSAGTQASCSLRRVCERWRVVVLHPASSGCDGHWEHLRRAASVTIGYILMGVCQLELVG